MTRDTSDARADVLAAIRSAKPSSPGSLEADYAGIVRDYARTPVHAVDERIALFADRLEHYNVGVYRAATGALREVLAEVCRARDRRSLVTPPDLPAAVHPGGVELRRDEGLSYEELDRCEGVLTLATLAIAVTGTIVLTHGAGEGRRALSLIPDYHLCVVRADQIVDTVPEAFARLAAPQPLLMTTISGPSATADIEMIRVRGVHGPRTLDVVIVS